LAGFAEYTVAARARRARSRCAAALGTHAGRPHAPRVERWWWRGTARAARSARDSRVQADAKDRGKQYACGAARRRQPVRMSDGTRGDTEPAARRGQDHEVPHKGRASWRRPKWRPLSSRVRWSFILPQLLHLPPRPSPVVLSQARHWAAAGPVLGPPPVHLKARSRSTNEHRVWAGSGHRSIAPPNSSRSTHRLCRVPA